MKRRTLLTLGGAALGAAALGVFRNDITRWALTSRRNGNIKLSTAPIDPPNSPGTECVLTPVQTDGPFFLRAPLRSDIREDRKGIPLMLDFQIVSQTGCTPIEGATVEIWHCDAAGRYSGYREDLTRRPFDTLASLIPSGGPEGHAPPVNGKTYLRGAQVSDANGMVRFHTIFPGWYDPRAPHIHIKVYRGDVAYMSTQFYFPDGLCHRIYSKDPDYKAYGPSQYNLGNDMVFALYPDGEGLLLTPEDIGPALFADARITLA